jgi:hypothetical protein
MLKLRDRVVDGGELRIWGRYQNRNSDRPMRMTKRIREELLRLLPCVGWSPLEDEGGSVVAERTHAAVWEPAVVLEDLRLSPLFFDETPVEVASEEPTEGPLPKSEALIRTRQIEALARWRYLPAIEAFAHIWRKWPSSKCGGAAFLALEAFDTPKARSALQIHLGSDNPNGIRGAVQNILETSPATAYDRLAPYIRDHQDWREGNVSCALLEYFRPTPTVAAWHEVGESEEGYRHRPHVPVWLDSEPRWTDFLVRMCKVPNIDNPARAILKHRPAQEVRAALERQPEDAPIARSAGGGDLVARYLAGERNAVWREIHHAGPIAGEFRQEVQAVADLTMQRCAQAFDVLHTRFEAQGIIGAARRTPPPKNTARKLRAVESKLGEPLPPSLRAFFMHFGKLGWRRLADVQSLEASLGLEADIYLGDVSEVYLTPTRLLESAEYWAIKREEAIHPALLGPFEPELGTDSDMICPTCVVLPCKGGDPNVYFERKPMRFVNYLRRLFRWACLPGLARYRGQEEVQWFVTEMTHGIEKF